MDEVKLNAPATELDKIMLFATGFNVEVLGIVKSWGETNQLYTESHEALTRYIFDHLKRGDLVATAACLTLLAMRGEVDDTHTSIRGLTVDEAEQARKGIVGEDQ